MSNIPFVTDIENPSDFEQHIIQASFQQLVLVDFWAPWCQPCQVLVPLLTKLAQEYNGAFTLAKINSDEHQELAMEVGVRNLPTVFLYKDGQIIDQFSGAIPEAEIKDKIDQYISSPLTEGLEEAFMALEDGNTDAALTILKDLNQKDPSNMQVLVSIANVYLQQQDLLQCEEIINVLPEDILSQDPAKSIASQLEMAKIAANAPDLDEIKAEVENKPDDFALRIQLATSQIAGQLYEEALDNLFYIIQKSNDDFFDQAKGQMIKVFEILGGQGELVKKYRQRLFSFLN